jgi:hypothetical protein
VDWLYDKQGYAALLIDAERFVGPHGAQIGWLHAGSAYDLGGQCAGWFDSGVLCDRSNRARAITSRMAAFVSFRPLLRLAAGYPDPPPRTECLPQFAAAPMRPSYQGWSPLPPLEIFSHGSLLPLSTHSTAVFAPIDLAPRDD